MYLTVDGVKSAVSLINKDKIMKMGMGYDKMKYHIPYFILEPKINAKSG